MKCRFFPESRSVCRTLMITLVAVGVSVTTLPSANAQWSVAPSFSAGVEFDDNPVLSSPPVVASDVFGYALEADAVFSYQTALNEFALVPRYLGARYDDIAELDSDDWFMDLDYSHNGQLSKFGIRATYADESIRRAERSDVDFNVEDPGEIPDDESGRLLGSENRQRVQVAPDWSYQLGERSLIRLGASYLDVNYDESSTSVLGDYQDVRGIASFEYDWSSRNTVTASGYYRENEFERTSSQYDGYGFTVGIARALAGDAQFVFNVGVDSTENGTGTDHTNPIGEISYTRSLQVSRVLASYRRTISGSGSNELSVRDSINLLLTRDLSEKVAVGAGISAYKTSSLDDIVVNINERDYVQLRALFTYRLTQTFSVDLDYRYTNIDRDTSSSDATSNLFNLWFRYRALR